MNTPAVVLSKCYHLAAGVLFAAIAVWQNPAAAADAQPSEVRPFEPAVVVSGTPRECGRAYGEKFKDAIHQFLEQEIYAALGGKQTSKQAMLDYAAACGKVTREVCPLVAEENEGIAAGAGLSYDEIILIQAHEELYHRSPLPEAPHGHCTAVAVSPTDSGDGHAYVGQTWDWMTRLAGLSSVVEWRRERGPSVLAYAYPGLPMGAGLNSRGIALCWTSGGLSRSGNQSPRVGVPAYTLIMHLLAQADLESVIREAQRDRHAGWFTFVIADADGNLVNIEGSPDGIAFERSSTRLARADFGTSKMTAAAPDQPAKLHPRCRHMYDLLETSAGKNDRAALEGYFTQRQYEIASWRSPKNKSIDVMIFDTTARKAYLTRGPEYGIAWREYSFAASGE